MDNETIYQLLVLLIWVFGGRLLRALRGGSQEEKPHAGPASQELDGGPIDAPQKDIDEPAGPDYPDEFMWPEQEYRSETKIAPAQQPEEVEQEISAWGLSDDFATEHVGFGQRLEGEGQPIPGLASLFSEKSTSNTVLLDGFLLSEILGTPRAYQS